LASYNSRARNRGNRNDHDLPEIFRRFHHLDHVGASPGSDLGLSLANRNSAVVCKVSLRTGLDRAVRSECARAYSALTGQNCGRFAVSVKATEIEVAKQAKTGQFAEALRIEDRMRRARNQTDTYRSNN